MKKNTFLLLFLLVSFHTIAQVLNQPANWPNTNWTVTGTFADGAPYLSDPTLTTAFAYNDDVAGNGVVNSIAAESPIIDLTAAFNAGETWLFVDSDYVFNNFGDDTLVLQYWDADTSTWINWIAPINVDTAGAPFDNYCAGPNVVFDSGELSIASFTATQLSGFKYRIFYDDNGDWGYGFCFQSPTILSQEPPSCLDVSAVSGVITGTTVNVTWTAGGIEDAWEYINQLAVEDAPTSADSGTSIETNFVELMNLTEGADYEFYVRADCLANGFSDWVGPYSYSITGPGELCSNPIVVTSPLPYSTDDNTSNYGDDYNGGPGANCGSTSGYLNGDDVVYQYSPTSDTSIDIELSNLSDTYAGIFVYTDCADIGVNCVAGATNGFASTDLLIDNFSVTAGTNYYIVISTWAAPQSVGYTLNITENTCVDPVVDYTVRQDCVNGPQFFVDVDLTDLGSATSITISDNQASTPQTTSATGLFTFGPFPNTTDVIITVANDDDANCTLTSTSQTQEFCQDFIVDCAVGPQTLNYCYSDGGATNPVIFTYSSNDGTQLNLTFNAGFVEQGWDELVVIDTDGSFIVAPDDLFYGNNGDLSGLTYQSSGDTISFYINSDGIFSCETEGYEPIDITVTCATCVNPTATYEVRSDCFTAPQFFVDVDVTDLGSANSLTLTDNQGSAPQTVTEIGLVSFGPFPNTTGVQITLTNDDDNNCVRTSSILTQEFCLDSQVDCAVGPLNISYCYINDDTNVFSYTSTDGSPLNLTINSGEIEGAPFDFLVILDSDGVTELYNGEGNDGDISGLTFQSTGDTIYFSIVSDFIISCDSGSFPDGIDYTVACATCINPAATYTVIDDCDNGEQFLIDVNITSLGDATSLTISNNIDTNTVAVNAVGVYQVGPFPFLQDVIITTSNDQDVNCVINSSPIQLAACPPANDNCDGATVATVNDDGTCTIINSGTILAATPSGIPPGACNGDPDDDVWFQFTALHEIEQITLSNIEGSTGDLDHAVYSGTCGSLNQIYCSSDNASVTPPLVVGQTYFIRVFSAGSTEATSTFDLCISQSPGNVLVDQTTYTVEQLILDVLIDSPCAQVSNITYSTGTNFGGTEPNGIGYFYREADGFPFENGIIMTTGDASEARGPNNLFLSQGTTAWPGDADLSQILTDFNPELSGVTNNATIIEFDFIPLADEISFDFLMASEEYDGFFECSFSDAFAFLLTDPNGNVTNLAVLPGSTTPILVTNIHPDNSSCDAVNEEYFGGYTPENLAPIAFDGRTAVFTAYSPVTVGGNYHIKLVIADQIDTAYDSGVFLKAGSFDIGVADLGVDITAANGNAVCDGNSIVLDTGITTVYHTWYLEGIEIPGENTNTITVTEPGEYIVQIGTSVGCLVQDDIIIEFLPTPEINLQASDLAGCNNSGTGFDEFTLSDNDIEILGTLNPADYSVTYFLTEQDAIDNVNPPLSSPYTNVTNPQTIWARVTNNTTGCFETIDFNLVVNDLPVANNSPDVTGCDFDDDGVSDYDLTVNEDVILGGQTDMTVTYHTSQAEADAGTPDITNPGDYSTQLTTIYVRVENNATGCYNTTSFGLTDGETPVTTFTTDFEYEVCPDATVPILITATPQNYTESEVSIVWYQDGGEIVGETGLTLPVLVGGLYEIEVRFNETGCSARTGQEVEELDNCIIPQGISPNGDGKNDTFDLSNFDVQRLEIFNRLGTLVYSRDNYTNEWYGQTDGGDELPVGTYFYTMVYEGGSKTKSSWVYINK